MLNNKKITFDYIRKSYSGKTIVENYGNYALEIGLWRSEEIMACKYFKKEGLILDIGCGAGRTTIGLYQLGFRSIIGIDLSPGMVRKARRITKALNLPVSFLTGNVLSLPFQDNSFDGALFSFNGIMQIPIEKNRVAAMAEIRRVLKHKGIFIFTTHNDRGMNEWQTYWDEEKIKWQKNRQDKRLYEFGDRIFQHEGSEVFLHFPVQEEVIECLGKSGLKLIENSFRSDICRESMAVKKVSNENRFWVVKK